MLIVPSAAAMENMTGLDLAYMGDMLHQCCVVKPCSCSVHTADMLWVHMHPALTFLRGVI